MTTPPLRRLLAIVAPLALAVPASLGAQEADTAPMLPHVAAALDAVADSLCAWAGRTRARGDTARVDFGDVLRPAVTARAVAHCPTLATPMPSIPDGRYRSMRYRLVGFQAEADRVRVELEVEHSLMNGLSGDWSLAAWKGDALPDSAGRWQFVRAPFPRSIADGTTRIVPDTTSPQRSRRWSP